MPQIVAESTDWVVAEKEAGLLSVPGRGPEKADCLYARLLTLYPELLVVHRLDQATSGLMLWARNKESQRKLSRQFEERTVHKEYEALVSGSFKEAEGRIELKQRLDVENRPLQIVDPVQGKTSITRWKMMGQYSEELSRIRLYPESGRTHQLRLHMAATGHPIWGDSLYQGLEGPRMALHAAVLEFTDPGEEKRCRFESPVPF